MEVTTNIIVRAKGGEYNARQGKVTASSTSSPDVCAQRLAEKLFGPALVRVVRQAGQRGDEQLLRFVIVSKQPESQQVAA